MSILISRSHVLGIVLGVVYGIALRLLFDLPFAGNDFFFGLVSVSFFVLVPIVIGFLTVFIGKAPRIKSVKWAIFGPWIAIFSFLVTSFMLLLEGSLCIVIALPAFLLFSSGGGLLAWWVARARVPKSATLSIALFTPIFACPLEQQLPVKQYTDTVRSSIQVEAARNVVWGEIVDVRKIDPGELAFSLTQLMGMPRPVEAHMKETDSGLVRNTRWERGVSFREIVTSSSPLRSLRWDFDFPAEAVPDGVLDDHVRIGGLYFGLIEGGYELAQGSDGQIVLTLETTYRVSARPSPYARLWAHVVLSDFHRMILKLIRDRSEAHTVGLRL